MKCVIIGAGGFIGRHLGQSLTAAGHGVVGVDVRAEGPTGADGFPIIAADVRAEPPPIEPGTDVVFYCAQWPAYRAFPIGAGDLFAVNVTGALRAAEHAAARGARFFCYASSGTVYRAGFTPFGENDPVRRDQGYVLSKLAAEESLRAMNLDMPVLCARLFGVYGPGQTGMLVHDVAGRVRRGDAVVIERNPLDDDDLGGLRLSLTFVHDLVDCVTRLAERALDGTDLPPVLNVAADEAVSIRTLANEIGSVVGTEPRFEVADRARASDFIADVGRLRALIDPAFTPLGDAIAHTLGIDRSNVAADAGRS